VRRADQINAFLNKHGWSDAKREPIAGDASNRRYLRLSGPNGRAIMMDAPSDKGEDVRPFVKVAEYLQTQGLSAPQILAKDEAAGFLLLEDLGDNLFARMLQKNPDLEPDLYRAAVDTLIALHEAPAPALPPYSVGMMTDLAALAYEWYCLATTDSKGDVEAFKASFSPLLEAYAAEQTVLIQRDYHAENVLWLPDRDGAASILQDARRDVNPATEQVCLERYVSRSGLDADTFHAAYAVLGVQRNLRIIGVFARLCVRDGKAHYVDLIPRVWGLLFRNLEHPALRDIAEQLENDLPRPNPTTLKRIKAKCATFPKQ